MTDLEMTKLCAEAIGLGGYFANGERLMKGSLAGGALSIYDPIHDDAQAMALVKRFGLATRKLNLPSSNDWWCATFYNERKELASQANDIDLNRTIVECVANMQLAKTSVKA